MRLHLPLGVVIPDGNVWLLSASLDLGVADRSHPRRLILAQGQAADCLP